MKCVIVPEETLDRLFDEMKKELDLGKYEVLEFISVKSEQTAMADAHRKWNYHLRMLQDRLKSAPWGGPGR